MFTLPASKFAVPEEVVSLTRSRTADVAFEPVQISIRVLAFELTKNPESVQVLVEAFSRLKISWPEYVSTALPETDAINLKDAAVAPASVLVMAVLVVKAPQV